MLAFPRKSGRQGRPVAKTSGFTLVELLTVIAIILILAAIVVGVQRGVYSSQANAKARAEIQAIATALERYKAEHGTYPRIAATSETGAQTLFNHLTGRTYSRINPSTGNWENRNIDSNAVAQPFIDVSTMTLNSRTASSGLHFVDPWGTPYVYVYRTGAGTANDGFGDHFFVLYSKGPDKASRSASNQPVNHASASDYFRDTSVDDIVYGLEYNP